MPHRTLILAALVVPLLDGALWASFNAIVSPSIFPPTHVGNEAYELTFKWFQVEESRQFAGTHTIYSLIHYEAHTNPIWTWKGDATGSPKTWRVVNECASGYVDWRDEAGWVDYSYQPPVAGIDSVEVGHYYTP